MLLLFEPVHVKINIMIYVPSKYSDQTGFTQSDQSFCSRHEEILCPNIPLGADGEALEAGLCQNCLCCWFCNALACFIVTWGRLMLKCDVIISSEVNDSAK